MPDVQWVFSFLGPLFLALGLWRAFGAGRIVPQARAWLMVGTIFSIVAAWLWLRA